MGLMQKLHKRASRLSLFDIDKPTPVCDGITTAHISAPTPISTSTSAPTSTSHLPHRPPPPRRSKTLDAEVAPVSTSSPSFTPVSTSISSPPPSTPFPASPAPTSPFPVSSASPAVSFEQLQPVEYIAPRPRRSRSSLGFDTLRRRMSILVSSPTVSVSPLPGCPGSPRLGPHGVLVTSGFFDEDGNPNPNPNPVPVPTHRNTNYNSSSFSGSYKKYNLDADAPVPRAVVPEPRRGRRPMSTVYTSLPPGAAEPVLGGIIFDKNQRTESLDDDTLFMPPRSLHLRSNSLSAADVLSFTTTPDDAPPPRRRESPARPRSPFARMSGIFSGAGHHAFSRGHNKDNKDKDNNYTMSRVPAVPPRSHLRGVPSSTPSMTSSVPSSAEISPVTSGRSSPSSHDHGRPYVLDVAPPIPDLSKDLPYSPVEVDENVITFGRANRRAKVSSGSRTQSFDRDPYKIRDGAEAQKARSGVYTPRTFPGPTGPTSPVNDAPRAASAASAHAKPSASAMNSAVRARTVSGFKRLSSAFAHHSQANGTSGSIQQPPPLPPRAVSNPVLRSPISPVTQISSPGASQTHLRQVSQASSSHSHHMPQRGSSSPSSSHSTRSISPPGTPTTPTSANTGCGSFGHHIPNLQSVQAARPVVIVPADVAPDFGRPASLDLEPTPKASPAVPANGLPTLSTDLPTPAAPFTKSPPTPLSPTAPKRARRKPVPRLDDDLLLQA